MALSRSFVAGLVAGLLALILPVTQQIGRQLPG